MTSEVLETIKVSDSEDVIAQPEASTSAMRIDNSQIDASNNDNDDGLSGPGKDDPEEFTSGMKDDRLNEYSKMNIDEINGVPEMVEDAQVNEKKDTKVNGATNNSKKDDDVSGDEEEEEREDTRPSLPCDSWQVAFVYAYLKNFTNLHSVTKKSLLTNVESLERALLDSSPPSTSKLYRDPTTSLLISDYKPSTTIGRADYYPSELDAVEKVYQEACSIAKENNQPLPELPLILRSDHTYEPAAPPSSPLLVEIMEHLYGIMAYWDGFYNPKDKKSWFAWTVRFVNARLGSSYLKGGLVDWEINLLRRVGVKTGRENEGNFWRLKWEEKIYIIRHIIDYLLTYSREIRKEVKTAYDNERIIPDFDTLDSANEEDEEFVPAKNHLSFEPLGTISSTQQIIYSLDHSARLYSLILDSRTSKDGISPSEVANFEWTTLTRTLDEYKTLIKTLESNELERIESSRSRSEKKKGKGRGSSTWRINQDIEAESKLLENLKLRLSEVQSVQTHLNKIEGRNSDGTLKKASRAASPSGIMEGDGQGSKTAKAESPIKSLPPPPEITARSARLRTNQLKAQQDYYEDLAQLQEREKIRKEQAEIEAIKKAELKLQQEEMKKIQAEEKKKQAEEKKRKAEAAEKARLEAAAEAMVAVKRQRENPVDGRRLSSRLTMQSALTAYEEALRPTSPSSSPARKKTKTSKAGKAAKTGKAGRISMPNLTTTSSFSASPIASTSSTTLESAAAPLLPLPQSTSSAMNGTVSTTESLFPESHQHLKTTSNYHGSSDAMGTSTRTSTAVELEPVRPQLLPQEEKGEAVAPLVPKSTIEKGSDQQEAERAENNHVVNSMDVDTDHV